MRSKLKTKRKSAERGQALILSLSVFLVFGMWACFFIFQGESSQRAVLKASSQRAEALTKAQKMSDLLNQVAINNRNILSALLAASQAFDEAYDLSKMRYSSLEPWKHRGLRSNRDVQENISMAVWSESILNEGSQTIGKIGSLLGLGKVQMDELAESAFLTFGKIGSQALRYAAGLTKKNQILKNELVLRYGINHQYFKESQLAETLCFANDMGFQGEALSFNSKRCYLEDKKTFYSGAILNLKKLSEAWSRKYNSPIGVLFVSSSDAKYFLASLKFEVSTASEDERFKTVLQEIVRWGLKNRTTETKYLKVISGTTHPRLKVDPSCKHARNTRQLISLREWELLQSCEIDAMQFPLVFYSPHWVPLILGFEKQGILL